jgi:cytochrome P450
MFHSVSSPWLKSNWYAQFNGLDQELAGVFALIDPKQHSTRRRLLAPYFTNSAVTKYEYLVREKATMAVNKIKRNAERGENVDILQWWTFMASDVIGELCFGRGFDSLVIEEVSNLQSQPCQIS